MTAGAESSLANCSALLCHSAETATGKELRSLFVCGVRGDRRTADKTWIRQSRLKAFFEMMDGMDFMDDMDTENTHLRSCVHSVHNVHSIHRLDKSCWLLFSPSTP